MADQELFLDPIDPAFRRDPYPVYARLLAELPVHRSPLGLVTYVRHEDCSTLLTDPRFGKDVTRSWFWQGYREAGLTPPLEPLGVGTDSPVFAFTDPPEHSRRRRAVTGALPGSWWEQQADRAGRRLAAAYADRSGSYDLVGEVARPFVLAHLADLLDVPDAERAEFAVLAAAVGPLLELDVGMDEQAELDRNAAAHRLRVYFAERLAGPHRDGPGAVGRLAAAVDAGELSTEDAAAVCLMVVIGAVEPLTGLVTAVVEHLPDEWRPELAGSPELVDGYVEEVLRLDPAVHQVPRVVLDPVTLGGVELEPGETVTAVVAAANRDPAVFADPDRVVPGRTGRQHLGLGTGPHVCFGARISRAVGRHAVTAAVRAGVRVAGDPAAMEVTEGVVLRRRAVLPVTAP
jgi:cytochrome P450